MKKAVPSLALLQQIEQLVPALTVVYNLQTGEYIYVNEAVEKLLGYKSSKFLQGGLQFVSSLVHPDDISRILEENQKAIAVANSKKAKENPNDPIVTFEYRMRHKNGSWRWVHSDGVVFDRDAKGNVLHVMNVTVDITERKLEEERILTEVSRFKVLIESSSDAIAVVNAKGEILYISPSSERILGYKPQELTGKIGAGIIHPEDLPEVNKKVTTVVGEPNATVTYQCRVVRKDKDYTWIESTVTNLTHDAAISGYVVSFRDIAHRKRSEEMLVRNEERLRLALDAGKIGVWDWDVAHDTIEWTDRVYEVHGVKQADFSGSVSEYTSMIHSDDQDRVTKAISVAIAEKQPYEIEFRIVRPSGEERWVSTAARVTYYKDKPIRMIGATIDITDRKQLETQKDDFIGIASHELKTPVTSLKAYAQVLALRFEKAGDLESANLLMRMDSQIDKLSELISDLLDVTKIETGKLKFKVTTFSLNELVIEVVEEMQRTTNRHAIKTKLDEDVRISADRDRTGQVLINLLSNAIKYSPQSDKIIVQTKLTEDMAMVSVQDFGIGMPASEKERVFERFFRISGPSNESFPGLGLGLYISAEIVNRQGGRMSVKSAIGKGSTFVFTMPLEGTIPRKE